MLMCLCTCVNIENGEEKMNIRNKVVAATFLLSSCAWSFEGHELELHKAWNSRSAGMKHKRDDDVGMVNTPPPSPPYPPPAPPTPVTPTTWESLEDTLINNPYYTSRCQPHGDYAVPLLVANLKMIETLGTDKTAILNQQLQFINSTWGMNGWSVWMEGSMDSYFFSPRRFRLIYNFLINQSKDTEPQTTYCFCWPF